MAKQAELDERIMQFISIDKDGISVDWEKLADFKWEKGYLGDETFQNVNRNLAEFLFQAGILVDSRTKGSYVVTGMGVLGANIGPPYPGSCYSFVRLEDVEDYLRGFKKGFIEGAALPAEIIKVR